MSRIKSKNTAPEETVRKILFSKGRRYRLHDNTLPGKPDIVFKSKKTAIFINGCFWHQHQGCKRKSMPKTNIEYLAKKLKNNIKKQKLNINKLKENGWETLIIWECETKNNDFLLKTLRNL